jgi:hypothetical protein
MSVLIRLSMKRYLASRMVGVGKIRTWHGMSMLITLLGRTSPIHTEFLFPTPWIPVA